MIVRQGSEGKRVVRKTVRGSHGFNGVPAHEPLRIWAVVAGSAVAVLGFCVMVGWLLQIEVLKRIAPDLASMKFNTALCFTLMGIAVVAGAETRVAQAAGTLVALIATISLAEYITGWNVGIDEAVFRDVAAGTTYPGRMAVSAAICLCLAVTALYGLRRDRPRLVTGAALPMLAIGWLGCLGYLFGVRALYDVGPFSTMAGHTAVVIVVLSIGILASSRGGVLAWIVRGDDPGATVLRSILPLVSIGMPLVAELRLEGQQAGWYGTAFGLAMMVVFASLSIAAVAVHAARVVNASHDARIAAIEQLHELNATLEARIEDRTSELATTEAWARALAGSAPIGIFRTNAKGALTYFNDRWCEIFGRSFDEGVTDGWTTAIHPEDREEMLGTWARAIAAGAEFDLDFRVLRPLGKVAWVRGHGVQVLGVDGSATGYVGTLADISISHEAQQALREAEELFRTSFDSSPIGKALVDGGGRIVRANFALTELTGYSSEEMTTMRAQSLLSPEDVGFNEQRGLGWANEEQRIVRKDRSVRWAVIRYAGIGRDSVGNPTLTVAQFLDTTERRQFEDRLAHTSNHDPLTGLLNRRSFDVALTAHVERCKRYGSSGAVLMLDIDHFKEVNDTYGHAVGDEVLVSTADRLRQRLRETDVIARLGGDEFVVLLPVGGGSEARAVAQSLVEVIRAAGPTIAGDRVPVTASVGIVVFDTVERSTHETLVNADLALYDAKNLGRDRWAEFAESGPDDLLEGRANERGIDRGVVLQGSRDVTGGATLVSRAERGATWRPIRRPPPSC